MKTLMIIAIVFLLSALPKPIFANENEAGEAGKLASGAATVSEKKPDFRVIALARYLESVDSPLAPHAELFIKEADRNNLDWRLVPAIAGLESSFGKHIPSDSYNAWGWGIFT